MLSRPRSIRALALLLAGLAGCGGGAADGTGAERANLLLLSIDSLRQDHVSAYGHVNPFNREEPTTPAFDRLAAEGVLFENAVSTTSWTLPAHMALMTGLPDVLHGVTENHKRLSAALGTLPELLRAHGYATGGFFSGPNLHPVYGFDRGFDVYTNLSHVDPDVSIFADPTLGSLKGMHRRSHKAITSPGLVEASSAWMRAQVAAGRPFFAFVHWWDPHYDYLPPEEYEALYANGYEGRIQGIHDREYQIEDWTRQELGYLLSLYDSEIRFTDDHLARLLDLLDELGVADDTLVIVTADHGEEFYEYGRWGHQRTLDDVVIDIPLALRFPGRVPAGVRPRGQARIQDVFATVAELLELEAPDYLESKSLVRLWEDPTLPGHVQHLYLDVPYREILLEGIVSPDEKILWQRTEGKGWVVDLSHPKGKQRHFDEFYNLKKGDDPAAVRAREALAELKRVREKLPPGWEAVPITNEDLGADLLEDLRDTGYLGGGEDE